MLILWQESYEQPISIQFSCSVMSNSLWTHELQHTRPPCLSPTPGVLQNPCPLSWWCHPTILSSVIPFSSCPQFFPASGSFQMSQLFTSEGQSIGVLDVPKYVSSLFAYLSHFLSHSLLFFLPFASQLLNFTNYWYDWLQRQIKIGGNDFHLFFTSKTRK